MPLQNRLKKCGLQDVKEGIIRTGLDWDWQAYSHPLYMFYKEEIIGKWVYHDEPQNLEKLASKIRVVIAEGLSPLIKYRPKLNDPFGPFSHLLPPLCVYSIPECEERLHDALVKFGLEDIYWQSNGDIIKLHNNLEIIGIGPERY